MTTHYFTNEHTALYMSEVHGITLDYAATSFIEDRYAIHPSSLPLFNAQKGDLVLLANGMEAYRYSTAVTLTNGEKIVMRNQQPFFMPEVTA